MKVYKKKEIENGRLVSLVEEAWYCKPVWLTRAKTRTKTCTVRLHTCQAHT